MSSQPGRDKVLPTTTRTSVSENIKKVAITMRGAQAQLIELDQNRPLAAIIQDIANGWNLGDPETYSLQFSETNGQKYITERNRGEIGNGNVLKLTESPAKNAQNLYNQCKLNSGPEERIKGLQELSKLSSDSTFATEFINIKGLDLLIDIVNSGVYKGEPLAFTLKSFVALMENNISWDVLQPEFIKRVAECVNCSNQSQDSNCLQAALEILELVVMNSTDKLSVVEQVVTPSNVIPYLEKYDLDVRKNAIALINALFTKADPEKKKKIAESLQTRSMRNIIITHVIRSVGSQMGQEMAHQLYVLQTLLLNLHEEKMNTPVDSHDQVTRQHIEELRRIAFDVDGDPNINTVRKSQSPAQDYKKLGFVNVSHPAKDFTTTPPGLLTLHNMLYFARTHGENYVKVVLENSSRADEHDCPFVKASIALTKKICDIFHIGEPPMEEGSTFYPMFFHHDKPLEEFFSVCIQLLNKTWKEMRATSKDFEKVLGVVKEQIIRSLDIHPATFDAFRNRLHQLNYNEIKKLWDHDRQIKEEFSSQAKPIIELRDKVTPEIIELIQQQRLQILEKGSRFNKYNNRGRMKDKYWYWKLAPNHKTFHYGDCTETDTPVLEQLHNKLPIVDIRSLQTGKDCPWAQKSKRGGNNSANCAFSIVPDTADSFNFVATSETEFDYWTDGINVLLGTKMVSSQMKQDLETLLSMEIKLRLLDTEGVTIPSQPPPIPKDPQNYDFNYSL
ncbi:hypothetical protein LOTGIDRAFT_222972 [Lottia gigantea]|uniref:ELMO domain-containing protein n=1 Tax=Lottia gigantea TaxID=225164 RepID=V3ZFY4_LOTGI|nr:hypothetical protein LOTGIDRAFT_222972 [Lottia gigantea]ESO83042.1 hypothetical protein LOTGIDRAFT_222972 [Lottia gigantea]